MLPLSTINTSSNSLLSPLPPAVLVLADGTTFLGRGIGVHGSTSGEVVFNTALTGYQEILTDPSYTQQIVTLTYPHIGNVGVNPQDCESSKVYAAGLVIRDLSPIVSNFRATESLAEYLTAQGIVGIAEIDTRALTRHLRDHGAQPGAIVAGKRGDSVQALLASAKTVVAAFPGMTGLD
ncbi:MAG: hypothetical protein RIR83_1082, partial [Pseudomonadota bacterium]